jgi:hypothetical protein
MCSEIMAERSQIILPAKRYEVVLEFWFGSVIASQGELMATVAMLRPQDKF